jgi:hypothetical protein
LRKSKAFIIELMKLMPDAHIAEEEDFVAWGQQFIDVTVSRVQIGGVDKADTIGDGSVGRVVMCNEAAAQRLYTCGNNEVLLRQFFLT